ncbi:unnamed protein product [Linum tenue]|uniref:HRDC domain-containing protein n=1 Tax=Linum tenue TaxID=586396 RepID=A0AAV0HIK1_9ROSI|nr:unnamed protein product [Linum tenue]
MSQDSMDVDQSSQSQTLRTLTAGPLSSSLSSLAASSRTIPFNKDFHFFYNFDEFKSPVKRISTKSQLLLQSIGSSGAVLKDEIEFPGDGDIDCVEASDWLVNVNDDIFERFDSSADEFEVVRKSQEENAARNNSVMDSDGFQTVCGKKKKKNVWINPQSGLAGSSVSNSTGDSAVKVADRKGNAGGKAKIPFHIPSIKRPQEEHNILVNNSNQPFEHVWLERSADGSRFVHPLISDIFYGNISCEQEKLSFLDFVDKDAGSIEPLVPPAVESTPFKLVKDVKDLKELAAKLRAVNEFAVDLEHNQYRSFQGLTCLMQISTRTEDFILDTLKLRIHVGPHLREIFKDPTKKKILHGANQDIVWLQRDFGIYICNMFDTGQASRVLKLERNSLEYLLNHFCGVVANKEYQNADWRLRPLPSEMIRYAREDTHYLLYIYDQMRCLLHSMPEETESSEAPLVEVYKRSYDVCMQLYEKELLTEDSYLHMYGLPSANFSAHQLAIVAGLYEWRDVVARNEDESTGYILPNKVLLEIAKQMPLSTGKLHRVLKLKHQYIERHLSSVVQVVRHQMQNAAAFEAAAQQLKELALEMASRDTGKSNNGSEVQDLKNAATPLGTPNVGAQKNHGTDAKHASTSLLPAVSPSKIEKKHLVYGISENGKLGVEMTRRVPQSMNRRASVVSKGSDSLSDLSPSAKVSGSTVQVQKKTGGIFGSILGNAALKRRADTDNRDQRDTKLEKIKSSVSLPFHSFAGRDDELPSKPEIKKEAAGVSQPEEHAAAAPAREIIMLDSESSDLGLETDSELEIDESEDEFRVKKEPAESPSQGDDEAEEPVSVSDLSLEPSGLSELKPFDYAAAAEKLLKFERQRPGPAKESEEGVVDRKKAGLMELVRGKKSAGGSSEKGDDGTSSEFRPGRRRHAFPASGNRSYSYR